MINLFEYIRFSTQCVFLYCINAFHRFSSALLRSLSVFLPYKHTLILALSSNVCERARVRVHRYSLFLCISEHCCDHGHGICMMMMLESTEVTPKHSQWMHQLHYKKKTKMTRSTIQLRERTRLRLHEMHHTHNNINDNNNNWMQINLWKN